MMGFRLSSGSTEGGRPSRLRLRIAPAWVRAMRRRRRKGLSRSVGERKKNATPGGRVRMYYKVLPQPARSHAMHTFLQRLQPKIKGVLSGLDRIRFRGTIRWLASLRGMASYLH